MDFENSYHRLKKFPQIPSNSIHEISELPEDQLNLKLFINEATYSHTPDMYSARGTDNYQMNSKCLNCGSFNTDLRQNKFEPIKTKGGLKKKQPTRSMSDAYLNKPKVTFGRCYSF